MKRTTDAENREREKSRDAHNKQWLNDAVDETTTNAVVGVEDAEVGVAVDKTATTTTTKTAQLDLPKSVRFKSEETTPQLVLFSQEPQGLPETTSSNNSFFSTQAQERATANQTPTTTPLRPTCNNKF